MIEKIMYGFVAIGIIASIGFIVFLTIALISVSPWLALWPLVVVGFLALAWAVGSLVERWL